MKTGRGSGSSAAFTRPSDVSGENAGPRGRLGGQVSEWRHDEALSPLRSPLRLRARWQLRAPVDRPPSRCPAWFAGLSLLPG